MDKPFKIALIADTHYYSPKLGTEGEAYRLRSSSDQKCLAQSGSVLDEAFDKIAKSGADALLIAGDLTNNGERDSHEELREKLYALQKKVPVYVLTATHDWCSDGKNNRYDGAEIRKDVRVLSAAALADFYKDFGPAEAVASYTTPLKAVSYAVDPVPGVRLLLLNDDCNGRGRAGYPEEHLQWIEAQIRDARQRGMCLLAAQHHPVIAPIHPFLTGGNCCGEREEIVSRFADAGLRVLVTGHLHMQDLQTAVSAAGNPLTEIALGAMCGIPGNIVYAELTENAVRLSVEPLTQSRALLERQTFGILTHVLDSAKENKAVFAKQMEALQAPKLSVLYPFARKWAFRMDTMTVAEAYKTLRRETLGLLPKISTENVEQIPLRDAVREVFLSIFGDGLEWTPEHALYGVVLALFSMPQRLLPRSKTCRRLRESGEALLQKKKLHGVSVDISR